MKTLENTLNTVYKYGMDDKWEGPFIRTESAKVHESYQETVKSLTSILTSPNSTSEDKIFARAKLKEII